MPLYGEDIYEEPMYAAIDRLFRRIYMRGRGRITPTAWRRGWRESPDYVYVVAYNQMHVVEAKPFRWQVQQGISQLDRYRGNYKYLALPDGECEDDWFFDELAYTLENRGYGLVLVGLWGAGLGAEVVLRPAYILGDFSRYYNYAEW